MCLMCLCVCFCTWTNLHLRQRCQPGSVQVQLLLQSLRGEELSTRQCSGEADIQYPSRRCIHVRLDVEDEDVLNRHWEHCGYALQEVTQQWRQEVLLGHVMEAHGNAVSKHVLGDDEDSENTLGWDAVDTVWKVWGRDKSIKISQSTDLLIHNWRESGQNV